MAVRLRPSRHNDQERWMRHAGAMHPQTVAAAFGLGLAASLSDPVARGELDQMRHPWPTSEIDPWFEAPMGRAEWKGVLKASRAAGAPHAARLAELLPALLEIEEILTPMRAVQTCHVDLWADNLRRSDGRP